VDNVVEGWGYLPRIGDCSRWIAPSAREAGDGSGGAVDDRTELTCRIVGLSTLHSPYCYNDLLSRYMSHDVEGERVDEEPVEGERAP
jgi:hypothetical protein